MNCFKCQIEIELIKGARVHKSEECPKCSQDIRCCKFCQFFDPNIYNECRETNAERILEKEKANFCDYYSFGSSHNQENEKQSAFDAADALFKK